MARARTDGGKSGKGEGFEDEEEDEELREGKLRFRGEAGEGRGGACWRCRKAHVP